MRAVLTVEMDGAAFGEDAGPATELARILRDTAQAVEDGDGIFEPFLFDSNGNRVGQLRFEDSPRPCRVCGGGTIHDRGR